MKQSVPRQSWAAATVFITSFLLSQAQNPAQAEGVTVVQTGIKIDEAELAVGQDADGKSVGGKILEVSKNSDHTITLPAISTLGDGLAHEIVDDSGDIVSTGGSGRTDATLQDGEVARSLEANATQRLVKRSSSLNSAVAPSSWFTDNFPEMIASAFYQEDPENGIITEWQSRGVNPKTATGTATKLPNQGGVLFAKDTQQKLSWAAETDAPWLHRWWVVIARADMDGNASADHVPVLAVNGAAGGAIHRQPYVNFVGSRGKLRAIIDNGDPFIQEAAFDGDFANWNIVVAYRRGRQYHAWINGVKQKPVAFTGMQANNDRSQSHIGTNSVGEEATMQADVAVDCVILGQSELNDAQVDKLVGWAHWRVGREDLLPVDHAYKDAPPSTADANDDPTRYEHDSEAWDTWAALSNAVRYTNRGNAPPSLDDGQGDDYSVVFFDNFAEDTIVDDLTGGETNIWYAPTHVVGIGVDALAQKKSNCPSCYIHDDVTDTMTLRLQESVSGDQNWVAGAFSSVNKEGQGRTWTKGRFRIRARFPKLAAPRPGFFPAFWTYDRQHLFWRTRNRLELDFFEYDGRDGSWINTTQHIHNAPISYDDPGIETTDPEYKIAGYTLTPRSNFDPEINIYDGQFHIWEFRIEDDFSYIICDNKEVARVPTEPWLLVKKYILVDWALRQRENPAAPGQTYDMTIDWIEVQIRERDLEVVPAAFSARPTLLGTRGAGNVITCTPNVTASQIEFRWYQDGEPILGETSATFTEDADSASTALRCHVRAVSVLDQPEAWTAEMPAP